MPRLTRRSPPAKRHASKAATSATTSSARFSEDDAPLIVPHHKHALIKAHADVRHKVRTGWGWGYYIGVAASCLVVVSGWWLTLDKNIRTNMNPGRDPLVQVLDSSAQDFQAQLQATGKSATGTGAVRSTVDQLREEYARARAQAEHASNTRSNATTTPSQIR